MILLKTEMTEQYTCGDAAARALAFTAFYGRPEIAYAVNEKT